MQNTAFDKSSGKPYSIGYPNSTSSKYLGLMTENELAKIVVDAAFRIHQKLGPGLFESVYEEVLSYELVKRGLQIERQKLIGVIYDDIKLDVGFKADIVVNGMLIIEIKSIETIAYVHQKQLLTYLRLMNLKLGLLFNFNEALIKDGTHRIINGF